MITTMKSIVRENSTCVMATTLNNMPHCSLMSYIPNDDCTTIYMVTHRNTRKFRNLTENPHVSLLIDTRENDDSKDRTATKALTVTGIFSPVRDEEKIRRIGRDLLARHPQLKGFIGDEGAIVFSVQIQSFQLLEGISESSFVEIT